MNEIDRLEVGVESDAKGAISELDKLDSKLASVQRTMSKLESGNFTALTRATERLSASIQKLSLGTNNVSQTISKINKLGEMKSGNLFNVASALDKFSTSMSKLQSATMDSANLRGIANALNRFGSVKLNNSSGYLDSLSHSLTNFATNMSGVQMPQLDGLGQLANTLSKLGRTTVSTATSNIPKLSNALSQLSGQMKTLNFNYDLSGLNSLASTMQSLGRTKTSTAINNLPYLASGLKTLSETMQSTSFKYDTTGISNLATAINMLGRTNTKSAIENIPNIAMALEKLINRVNKLPKVSANLINFTYSLAALTKNGSKVGSMIRSTNSALSNTRSHANSASSGFKSLASTIGMLYAKYWTLVRVVQAVGKAISKPIDYIETLNYFNTSMEQIGKDNVKAWEESGYKSAETYVRSFSDRAKQLTKKMTGFEIKDDGSLNEAYNKDGSRIKSLGLDPEEIMNYQATFAQMSNSAGLTAKSVMNISDAMTMLGSDWSSLKNTGVQESMNKFASGLAGSIRPLREYGIDISQATLKQLALNYGIETSITKMSNAAKMQLRTIAVLRQSKVTMGDLAKTMNSPANQLRVLRQNFSMLAQSIGSLFIPIVAKVLPYINGLVIAIRRLFTWIGSLMGIKLSDYTSSIGSTDLDLELDDVDDSLDTATEKAEKLKRTLFSFDKANILGDKNNSDDSNNGIDDSKGYAVLDDAIAKEVEDYKKKWDEVLKRMDDKAGGIADKICRAFKRIYDYAEPTRTAVKKLWDDGLAKISRFNDSNLRNFYNNFLKPFGKWSLGTGFPRFFEITNSMLSNTNWGKLDSSLSRMYSNLEGMAELGFNSLLDIYQNFFAPLGTWTLSSAIPQLADVMSELYEDVEWEKLRKGFADIAKALEPIAEGIGQGFIDFARECKNVLTLFLNYVVPPLQEFVTWVLDKVDPDAVATLTSTLLDLGTALLGIKLAKGVLTDLKILRTRLAELSKTQQITIAIVFAVSSIKWAGMKWKNAFDEAGGDKEVIQDALKMMFDDWFTDGVLDEVLSTLLFGVFGLAIDKFVGRIAGGDWASRVASSIYTTIGGIFAEIGNTISGDTSLDDWGYAFKNFGKDAIQSFSDGISEAIKSVRSGEFVNRIKQWFADIDLKDKGKSMVSSIKSGWNSVKTTFSKWVGQKGKDIKGWFIDIDLKSKGISMITSIKNGWNGKKEAFKDWVAEKSDNVKTWFKTIDLSAKGKAMVTSIKSGWNDAKEGLKDWLSNIPHNIKSWIGDMKSVGSGLVLDLINGFKSMKLPKIKIDVSYQTEGVMGKIGKAIGLEGFPKLDMKFYANGGFPTKGEFFVAREAGPEMVGSIGGKTAVANNDQITTAIAQSVQPAIYNGTLQAMRMSGGSNKGKQPVTLNLIANSRAIGQIVIDDINNITDTTCVCPINVG